MRVTDIELFAGDYKILSFPLGPLEPGDRFQVKAVYGLDADEVFPKFYGFGNTSQDPFYRIGRKPRELVMRLVLNPNWALGETYSDLRDDVYRAISKSRTGKIDVYFKAAGSIVAVTEGRITKLEVPHFNKDAELQLTMVCEDPFLHSYSQVEYTSADFSANEIVISDHVSTAPHGFEMKFTFLGGAAAFEFSDSAAGSNDWQFRVAPESNFLTGDEIYFSSVHGKKRLDLVRGGVTTSLMDRVWSGSVWPVIFPGDNYFYFFALTGNQLDYLRFNHAFWGV